MTDCIFCKIVAGEAPCEKLFEDENFLAFLDLTPDTQGHTLIIPKQHVQDFTEFPVELGEQWFVFTKMVIDTLKKKLGSKGFNIGMNNGRAAGQIVFHQHTHIIPRYPNDGLKLWEGKHSTFEERVNVQKRILG